ncbi:hypothetical protein F1D05_14650 [Kribbella qitaiheensis]|uniref:Capsule synthesis protein CapA domain-containing protein n=1 Tax=Kribbella qitaiheensis TaxID=1544730 RepID=A0A7G6X9L9_9ACTN|nr:hypothetical protein F1D05_14650 [Kribbella qitaiheensis]
MLLHRGQRRADHLAGGAHLLDLCRRLQFDHQLLPQLHVIVIPVLLSRSWCDHPFPVGTTNAGHHAHVVQPMQEINGKWVAYGLGNLAAAHREPGSRKSEGLLVRFTFAPVGDGHWKVQQAGYAPLLVTDTVPDFAGSAGRPGSRRCRSRTRRSRARSAFSTYGVSSRSRVCQQRRRHDWNSPSSAPAKLCSPSTQPRRHSEST